MRGRERIVLGIHGRGGLRRLILGSVADKVIRATHRPVLVHRGAPFHERSGAGAPRAEATPEATEARARR